MPTWQRGAPTKRILDKPNRRHPALRGLAHPAASPSPGWPLSLCEKSQRPFGQAFCGLRQVRVGFCHLPPKEAEVKRAVTAPPWVRQEPPLLTPLGRHPTALPWDRRLPGPRLGGSYAAVGHHGWPPCTSLPLPHGGHFQATCLHLRGMRWYLPPRRCGRLPPSLRWRALKVNIFKNTWSAACASGVHRCPRREQSGLAGGAGLRAVWLRDGRAGPKTQKGVSEAAEDLPKLYQR